MRTFLDNSKILIIVLGSRNRIMQIARNSAIVPAAMWIISGIFGCGGGGTMPTPTGNTTAALVVLLGTATTPVTVSVDSQVLANDLTYLSVTNPLIVKSGMHQLQLQNANGNIVNASIDLSPGGHHTFIVYGFRPFASGTVLLTDDTAPASDSKAKLRIIDDASTIAGVDAYVVPFGNLPGGTAVLSNLGEAAQEANYQTFAPGIYDIYLTATGTTQIFTHSGALTLAANQNRTVVLLNVCPTTGDTCDLGGRYATVTLSDLN
jgi:hypothetical protein